ncbi:hypothetical protein [Methylomagnum sp.]
MKIAFHAIDGAGKNGGGLDLRSRALPMLQNSNTRRHVSLALIATGGVLFMIAPENSGVSLLLAGLGVLFEVLGIRLGHPDR